MSKKHRLKKFVLASARRSLDRSEMRYIDGTFTCSATANSWKHTRTVKHAETASAIAAQVMPCDASGTLASVSRAGIEGVYTQGRYSLAIRMKTGLPYDTCAEQRATKKARAFLAWMLRAKTDKGFRLFPRLKIRELNSAPERTGKIRLAKRFAPLVKKTDGRLPVVEFTRAAGIGSPWYSVTGLVSENVLHCLRAAHASGIVQEIVQTHSPESTGTNAYMPLDHRTRAKRRMELKLALAAAQDATGVRDTLRHPAPGKETIYTRKHGRKTLASESPSLRAAMADCQRVNMPTLVAPADGHAGPHTQTTNYVASPYNEQARYVRRSFLTVPYYRA